MKKIFFAVLLLCASGAGFAQCDKPVILTSSKTEYLDASGNVERTEDEQSTVEIRKDTMIISPGNEPHTMMAAIKSNTCNWNVPFKEGKSVIKATLNNEDGTETKNITITIEGKDGKIIFIAVMDHEPNRQIRLPIDAFKEKS